MIFETIESEGLAHLSYLLGDEDAGVAVAIDPRRDVEVYLDLAQRHDVRITAAVETHIHADFVSGSRELAARAGAAIYGGPSDQYAFEHQTLNEGDALEVGNLRLEALRTPGHTPEHVSLRVGGGRGAHEPWGLFTGDTLFAGEVGRPDLLGAGTEEPLARQLFHSLHARILKLGDELEVYPAHGAGSPCGGRIGDRRSSTLGYERRHNPRLQTPDEDEFVRALLESLPPVPAYYARLKRLNAAGPPVLGCLPTLPPLDVAQFQSELEHDDALVLDTREMEAFGGAHVPGALNIALHESFPIWAGWMLRPEQRLLLVLGDDANAGQVYRHLLRVGIENVAGFLRHGMRAWLEAAEPFSYLPQMSVHDLYQHAGDGHRDDGLQVLDVRRDDEWRQGHVPRAAHVFAPYLHEHLDGLDHARPVAVYCSTGFRASIAASVLQRAGFREVYNVPGSMTAWKAAGYALTNDG